MARLINGANGPFIGKVGSVIGYSVNGVGYLKGPYKKRTKKPTPSEALNRKKFAAAQAWLQPRTPVVRAGFKNYNDHFQGFLAAKSWLIKHAVQVIDNEIIIDPSLARISSGSLTLPENISCSIQEPNSLSITWTYSGGGVSAYDQAMVVAYNVEHRNLYGKIYGKDRDSCEERIQIPPGETVHTYLAFIAADRSGQSDSVYLGKFKF